MKKIWKVAYRQGGRDRFRWVLIPTEFPTQGQAMLCMADLMRQGYHALVHAAARILEEPLDLKGLEALWKDLP